MDEKWLLLKSHFQSRNFENVYCVAGGWRGGSIGEDCSLTNCQVMWAQCVESSILAAKIASNSMNSSGFLLLTGSIAALGATPGMIGYGMAKAAVHQLTLSLSKEFNCAAILP